MIISGDGCAGSGSMLYCWDWRHSFLPHHAIHVLVCMNIGGQALTWGYGFTFHSSPKLHFQRNMKENTKQIKFVENWLFLRAVWENFESSEWRVGIVHDVHVFFKTHTVNGSVQYNKELLWIIYTYCNTENLVHHWDRFWTISWSSVTVWQILSPWILNMLQFWVLEIGQCVPGLLTCYTDRVTHENGAHKRGLNKGQGIQWATQMKDEQFTHLPSTPKHCKSLPQLLNANLHPRY